MLLNQKIAFPVGFCWCIRLLAALSLFLTLSVCVSDEIQQSQKGFQLSEENVAKLPVLGELMIDRISQITEIQLPKRFVGDSLKFRVLLETDPPTL